MKVLIYFPRKKVELFFEGAMLEYQLMKACKVEGVTILDKFSREVDIANFINLTPRSASVIRQAAVNSIPTLLWMFFANNDEETRIIEMKNDGRIYIPTPKLDLINIMDAVIVPTNEAKVMVRKLGVKIPVFVITGAVDTKRVQELMTSKADVFRRYFRINEEQKYAMSVLNLRAKYELEQLNSLASALPDYNFYTFISAGTSLIDQVRLKTLDKRTVKNLIISELVPEDVYRSGLINASYYIDIGREKMNVMTLYEPMFLKVPLILNKEAVFTEIVDKGSAFIVNDFNGAAFVIRSNKDATALVEKAHLYTKNNNAQQFSEAIYNLFRKIYTR